jgi:hypothetical protein
MKHIGLVAFGITTSVLVPTALHRLIAGPNQVAKLVAPDEKSILVGDAQVDVSLDRGLVDAGGKVHVTLTASAAKRVKVPLAVLVYEQAGMAEGRTEAPPVNVGSDEVVLDVKDGKASKTFAFTLPGHRAGGMGGPASFGHYTVLVMAPKAAAQLESKRRHARNSDRDPNGFFEAYNAIDEGNGADGSDANGSGAAKLGAIARLDVNTRTASDHLAIIASDTARQGDDISVKVRLKNPLKRAFKQVELTLAAQPEELGGQWNGLAREQVTIAANPDATFALAPHETRDVVFHVHTGETGTLGLFASVECTGDDCYGDGPSASGLDDSVLDAIDILPAPEQADAKPAQTAQAAVANPELVK